MAVDANDHERRRECDRLKPTRRRPTRDVIAKRPPPSRGVDVLKEGPPVRPAAPFSLASGRPTTLCAWSVSRQRGRSIASSIAASSAASRSAQSIGWTRKWAKSHARARPGRSPAAATPASARRRALDHVGPRLGADAQPVDPRQSRQACRCFRPRSRNPRSCSASISAVELEHRLAAGDHHQPAARAPRPTAPRHGRPARSASANLPPPGPSVPTKSVSQKLHCALAPVLLASRPQIAPGKAQEHRAAARPARPRPAASGKLP